MQRLLFGTMLRLALFVQSPAQLGRQAHRLDAVARRLQLAVDVGDDDVPAVLALAARHGGDAGDEDQHGHHHGGDLGEEEAVKGEEAGHGGMVHQGRLASCRLCGIIARKPFRAARRQPGRDGAPR